ncbi:MAG: glycosyltransferase family A protein [Planctomycetota bacterium]
MSLTVVICSRNRREPLLETLRSLASQRASLAWSVLVVDNGSSDGTAAAVQHLAQDFPVALLVEVEPRRGLSHARNHALRSAAGEHVIFIDDDVTCLPGWLASHGRALARNGVAAAGGRIRPILPADTPPWLVRILMNENGGPCARYDLGERPLEIGGDDKTQLPCGANMAVHRATAIAMGGFKTDLGWGERMIPGEESEFFRRLLAHGHRIAYVPDAQVDHRIATGRLTRAYYTRWHRAHGRATIVARPPRGLAERLARIAEELPKAVVWAFRARRRKKAQESDPMPYGEALRKGAKAQGRLLELFGL